MTNRKALARLSIVIGTFACVSGGHPVPVKHMQEVPYVNTVPEQTEAIVIFLRTGEGLSDRHASVFEVPDLGAATLIGTFARGNKLAYTTRPGRHTFMVVGGGTTDFMDADLRAGKVYFVRVALLLDKFLEFSLQPIRGQERVQFRSWLADAIWVETTHQSLTWAYEHSADTEQRRSEHLPEWRRRPQEQRLTLHPEDGL